MMDSNSGSPLKEIRQHYYITKLVMNKNDITIIIIDYISEN